MASDSSQTRVDYLSLPTLEEVRQVLEKGLKRTFHDVSVKVVECPDLTLEPFFLAAPGLCGNTAVIQVGSRRNMFPLNKKSWYLPRVLNKIYREPLFVIGAGLQCGEYNNELIANFTYSRLFGVNNKSYLAFVREDEECEVQPLTNADGITCDVVGNFFSSNGIAGKVLEICAKQSRNVNLMNTMQTILQNEYGLGNPIGIGGTFLVKNAIVSHKVIPRQFPIGHFHTYDVISPVVAVGTICSFNLIPDTLGSEREVPVISQHFHAFSTKGWGGGHFYKDCTPFVSEYRGYFNIATCLLCHEV